jgi:putative phosphoribosyl transferase
MAREAAHEEEVRVEIGHAAVYGDLRVPDSAAGLVIFAHGSGSSRFSSRNLAVADVLVRAGCATLLLDLLTREEESIDVFTRQYRFDIERLAERVIGAVDWAGTRGEVSSLPIGCFGASTGAAAALIAAAARPGIVRSVVSRGGRPDLAGEALPRVESPTLLIVGGHDEPVLELNREAMARMRAPVELAIVPGATHLFEEPGALDYVSRLAADWFGRHLPARVACPRVIPVPEWPQFLATFGRAHRSWLATIERTRPGTRPAVEEVDRPLAAVTPELGAQGVTAIDIALQDAFGQQVVHVRWPVTVRVEETAAGAIRELEIVGEDGERVRMRFHATQLPEMLDGIAPGEIADAIDSRTGPT